MIYLDNSTTVKRVAAAESTALIEWLNGRPDEDLATSAVGHI
jgi:hypothetical protein